MNSYKVYKIIVFLILEICVLPQKSSRVDYIDSGYESLIKWGSNKKFEINKKIKLTKFEDEKQYVSIKDISKDKIILDIPPEMTLSINRTLSLLNSNDIRAKYQNYTKENKKNKKVLEDTSQIEQSFLAYLLYKANKTKSNELKAFYEYYKPLFYIFEDDISHLPSFFTDEQIGLLINISYFGSIFNTMNLFIMREVMNFQKNIFKEKIELKEYLPYRFLLVQKTYNISNITTVAPFIDYFKRDYNEPNCKLIINKKGHIKIKAKRDIKKGEILTLKPNQITNQYSFIFYGKTYDELIDNMPSFIIPVINKNILIDEGIKLDIDESKSENRVDLAWNDFFVTILPIYQGIAKKYNKDDSYIACYNMVLNHLNLLKGRYDQFKLNDLERIFNNKKDLDNVKRIIDGEKNFLDKKIKELLDIIEQIKELTNEGSENMGKDKKENNGESKPESKDYIKKEAKKENKQERKTETQNSDNKKEKNDENKKEDLPFVEDI